MIIRRRARWIPEPTIVKRQYDGRVMHDGRMTNVLPPPPRAPGHASAIPAVHAGVAFPAAAGAGAAVRALLRHAGDGRRRPNRAANQQKGWALVRREPALRFRWPA